MITNNKILLFILSAFVLFFCGVCSKKKGNNPMPVTPTNNIEFWLTKADQSVLLQKQQTILSFSNTVNNYPNIEVDSTTTFQSIDGFGYTLTGGSAFLINKMGTSEKSTLLNELFGNGNNSIGVSYLRVSIGASDLDPTVFSYDDMPTGQIDPSLANFSLSKDTVDLIPVLKQILTINPNIKIMGTPWSPPVWMKNNGSSIGGSLQPQYYSVYAQYLVKYIQAMAAKGIKIDALTVQNEPQHGGNNPSMLMSATQQTDFIKNYLGPAFQSSSINTKIIIWDHNCDRPDYPIAVLNDAVAKTYINGTAFHLYAGDISALSTVRNAHPDKNIYFTEQYTSSTGNFGGDLKWHLKNVLIGSMRNWSKNMLEWNLANDSFFGPYTPGGCTTCKGALTINGSSFSRNVSYYIVAHASKFVPAGSVRIASTSVGNLYNVSFKTPAGNKVLIVENDGDTNEVFNIKFKNKLVATSLEAGSVATYIW